MENNKPIYPYELATLYDAKGDLKKRWCVNFKVYSLLENKLVRRQHWISSKLNTKAARYKEGKKVIRNINTLLVKGYVIGKSKEKKRFSKQKVMTFLEAFEWAKERREVNVRKRSMQAMGLLIRMLEKFLDDHGMKDFPLVAVNHEMCDEFMAYVKRERKISNKTFNNYLGFVKSNFNFLVKNKKIPINPAMDVSRLKEEESERVSFPKKVRDKLLVTYEKECPELKIFAQYIYYTFIRPKELRYLKVKHIHEKSIHIPGHVSKNGKTEHVLISPALERLFQQLDVRKYPPDHYLIGSQGKPSCLKVSANYFTKKHLEIRKKLDLPQEYTLYCWKHTGVVDTYIATKDIDFVSRHCRHSSLDMTKNYIRALGLMMDYHQKDSLPDLEL
ncbi:tyrosine-type recombinase/integrase [Echinicola strongylocentroti]|uniref:tyrosine-type recombinase/integrase n=1 Tax=Echinicola strongylocentroti TaxID=1795355 RepID=UPI0013A694E2|nr:site-specific integrase [Echinicola strongylocentroti]